MLGKRVLVGDFAAMAPPSGVPITSARGQLMTRPAIAAGVTGSAGAGNGLMTVR